jgi:arylsulfatase A-like enzyme
LDYAGPLGARALLVAANLLTCSLLFTIADGHAGYVLRAQGNRPAETPNLDGLAAEGTHFSRHHCNSPVCTPSRQSILTGQLPHAASLTVLTSPWRRVGDGLRRCAQMHPSPSAPK